MALQSVWLYLAPIFCTEDVIRQMPTEGMLFLKADRVLRAFSTSAAEGSNAKAIIEFGRIEIKKLEAANTALEGAQKGLSDYIEAKQLLFPRFFFVSHDELLRILSETKETSMVQHHLRKFFEGIDSVTFDEENSITGIVSVEGEELKLQRSVDPRASRGNVEMWLLELEAEMRKTVQVSITGAGDNYSDERLEYWAQKWPGQAAICASQLLWTSKASQAIVTNPRTKLKQCLEWCEQRVLRLCKLSRCEPDKRFPPHH
eukprot:GHVU01133147.1.p1 GENE.GHVU01133147.1~~GHVU01133147.1.p1  ORF type:complete len:259 (+),score=39.59 GHVU01133147.1:1528-2304(+)